MKRPTDCPECQGPGATLVGFHHTDAGMAEVQHEMIACPCSPRATIYRPPLPLPKVPAVMRAEVEYALTTETWRLPAGAKDQIRVVAVGRMPRNMVGIINIGAEDDGAEWNDRRAAAIRPGAHFEIRRNPAEVMRFVLVEQRVNTCSWLARSIGTGGALGGECEVLDAELWHRDVHAVDPIPTHEPAATRGRARLKPGVSL